MEGFSAAHLRERSSDHDDRAGNTRAHCHCFTCNLGVRLSPQGAGAMTNILLIAGRYQLGNNAGFSRTPTMLATAWNFPFERLGSIRMPKRSDSFSTPPMWKHGAIGRVTELRLTAKRSGGSRIRPTPTVLPKSSRSKCRQRLGEDSERKRQPRIVGRTGEAAYAARLVGRFRSDQNRDRRNTGSVLRVEVIQPGCSQSDSRHDAAAEVRRVPPRQNCAKISGCIGSRIPMGERGPRPIQ